jgi:asparagine synthase (glutamine-hydrolysing)
MGYTDPHPICMGASLLDISGSRIEQPLINNSGTLVFNGEIYSDFRLKGFTHTTVSDTEWLMEQFRDNDYNFLRDIDWHGAIGYYDKKSKQLTLIRDHFGSKPLWVNIDRRWKNLLFSSTLSAFFQKSISGTKVEEYKSSGDQWYFDNTPYKGITKMSPGEVLVWDCVENKRVKTDNLWNGFKLERNEDFTLEEFRDLCIKSIEMVSKHRLPRGLMLSGGLDSSVIAGIMRDDPGLTCFSSSFEQDKIRGDKGQNDAYMKEYAKQCEMAARTASFNNLPFEPALVKEDDLETWSHIYMASHHYFFNDKHRQGTRAITFKKARDAGCKIVLTGDGADELFTGYNNDFEYLEKSKGWTKEWINSDDFYAAKSGFSAYPVSCAGDDPALNRAFWRLLSYGETNCLMSDSCAGMFGMEFRAPFLTQKFAKYCLTIPIERRMYVPPDKKELFGTYKYLLRHGFFDILPDEIRENYKKTGWASPYNSRDPEGRDERMTNNVEFIRYLSR